MSTAEDDTIDTTTAKEYGVLQPLMMADIGTKALSESNFEKLRDIINGNSWEDNQREHSETNYSFLMFNVTDKGYESEGGESRGQSKVMVKASSRLLQVPKNPVQLEMSPALLLMKLYPIDTQKE